MTGQMKIVMCDADVHDALTEYLNRHLREGCGVKVKKFEYREMRTSNNEWTIFADPLPRVNDAVPITAEPG